jgi:hypothetical protein
MQSKNSNSEETSSAQKSLNDTDDYKRPCAFDRYRQLLGKKINAFTVLRLIRRKAITNNTTLNYSFRLQCACGNRCTRNAYQVERGDVKDCGCTNEKQRKTDRTYVGKTVHGLLVTGIKRKRYASGKQRHVIWKLRCHCGKDFEARASIIFRGQQSSCGCLTPELKRAPGESGFKTAKTSYLRGARQRGLDFELTDEQLHMLFTADCAYCGKPPYTISRGSGRGMTDARKKHSAYVRNGIDRIDNDKGYTIDNVKPACKHCNWMRRDMPVDAFLDHVKAIYERSIKDKK